MRRSLMMFLTLSVLSLCATPAGAVTGTLVPPTLKAGQQVYTIPDGFEPPGIGKAGIESLNGQLNRLHYPFKVVFVESLPDLNGSQMDEARQAGFSGDRATLLVEYGTAGLVSAWAESQPNEWNTSTDTVFLLSFEPRKFAWVPGMDRQSRLQINTKSAREPYEQQFKAAVRGEPKDPVGGIAAMASAFDEFVFDQTDPIRIAGREEATRKANEALRLRVATGNLDREILRLSKLLGGDFLPKDVSAYQATLTKAKAVRAEGNPTTMREMTDQMQPSTDVLEGAVSEIRTAAFWHTMWLLFKVFAVVGLFVLIWFMWGRRSDKVFDARRSAERYVSGWEEKIDNATQNWMTCYTDRENILGLDGIEGSSKEFYDLTTKLVDDLLIQIQAMGKLVKEARALLNQGNWFNIEPFQAAINKLSEPFEFDTGVMNKADLFGGQTVTVTVDPDKFSKSMKGDFEKAVKGWDLLGEMADMRLTLAADALPQTTLDEMLSKMETNSIPQTWLASHPLIGDDESDLTFWEGLDKLRQTDPLAYGKQVVAEQAKEKALVATIDRIVQCREDIAGARVESPDLGNTVVPRGEDPKLMWAAARQAEARFEGVLASTTNIDEVETVAKTVCDTYRKVRKQTAEILAAVKGAKSDIDLVGECINDAKVTITQATHRHEAAQKVHAKLEPVGASIEQAQQSVKQATKVLATAKAALGQNAHLDAQTQAQKALAHAKFARKSAQDAIDICDRLDQEAARFAKRAKEMASARKSKVNSMSRYGDYARMIPTYQPPTVDGRMDYVALNLMLTQQENAWDAEVRAARRDYDAEQRRIQEEAERAARRRREEAEAERRRQSSYHSSSSSSYGGGGFSGGSGSYGGGGFSGGSGDW